jgi:hypothetical protein
MVTITDIIADTTMVIALDMLPDIEMHSIIMFIKTNVGLKIPATLTVAKVIHLLKMHVHQPNPTTCTPTKKEMCTNGIKAEIIINNQTDHLPESNLAKSLVSNRQQVKNQLQNHPLGHPHSLVRNQRKDRLHSHLSVQALCLASVLLHNQVTDSN